jgi:alkylation response protein AidB-like acyl-CoA dehydrogenase
MGRVLCCAPYLSTAVLAADAVTLAGDFGLAVEVLAGIADGSVRATLVAAGDLLGEDEIAGRVRATEVGQAFELNGCGGITLDGAAAQTLVVAASLGDDGIALFAVDAEAAGLERHAVPTVDATRRTAVVDFQAVAARRLDAGRDTEARLRLALDRAAISVAAESVGGARRALDMTIAYMHERKQFGGPVGRFQALKHRLADLHVLIEGARECVYAATDAVESGDEAAVPAAASAAKSAAAECFSVTTAEAIQLHGAIGFTAEHDIGLYYKRALFSAALLGTPGVHQDRIARQLDV